MYVCMYVQQVTLGLSKRKCDELIAHPHLLVRATSERFLQTRVTFRSVLTSESHWLQLLMALTVRWWPALVSVGGLLT